MEVGSTVAPSVADGFPATLAPVVAPTVDPTIVPTNVVTAAFAPAVAPTFAPTVAPTDAATAAVTPATNAKKPKRLNYQTWEITAIVFGCHAATIQKPQSTIIFRSQFLRDNYPKFAAQSLKMYGIKGGIDSGYTI